MAAFLPPLAVTTPHRRSSTSNSTRSYLTCTLPQTTNTPSPKTPSPNPVLKNISERLQQELPTLFTSTPDYTIYSPEVTFEDPLNKFRGIDKYASNISFLNNSPVFSSANLTLHDTKIINSDTVRTRWTLSMVVNLPWAPCVAFTGQSDYVVNLDDGKVIRHYDYWDSLQDSAFFSFPAVADLVTQCRQHIGPRDLGGFDLLRRTTDFQIRRFKQPIFLDQLAESKIQTWQPAQTGDKLTCVAVLTLPGPPTSQSNVADSAAKLKALLKGKTYATTGDKYYYVCPDLRGKAFHEVWLELTNANAFVDT